MIGIDGPPASQINDVVTALVATDESETKECFKLFASHSEPDNVVNAEDFKLTIPLIGEVPSPDLSAHLGPV
jgi:hypothetical protein